MAKQYHNEIDDLDPIGADQFENIFKVHQDGDFYFYNILRTINFPQNLNDSYYTQYRVRAYRPLTALSYKFYNTTKLWWLIVLVNNINNPVKFIEPGTVLKIINPQYVSTILDSIKGQLN
jgi:hypothetical protein